MHCKPMSCKKKRIPTIPSDLVTSKTQYEQIKSTNPFTMSLSSHSMNAWSSQTTNTFSILSKEPRQTKRNWTSLFLNSASAFVEDCIKKHMYIHTDNDLVTVNLLLFLSCSVLRNTYIIKFQDTCAFLFPCSSLNYFHSFHYLLRGQYTIVFFPHYNFECCCYMLLCFINCIFLKNSVNFFSDLKMFFKKIL